jgi:diadenylate cyclase
MIVYRALLFIRGTGAVQMLAGLGIVAGAYIISIWQQLDTLNWVLEQFFGNLLLVVVILFQGEIRKALAMIGRNPFFTGVGINQEALVMEELIKAAKLLSTKGLGALIVLEREIGLDNFIERGVAMDAEVVAELVDSMFATTGPLHDGALIVKGGRIKSAGCFLPLSTNVSIPKYLGTRHRAAIGITEETDALVIVVSEENKSVGIAEDGKLEQNVDLASLRRKLYKSFNVDIEKAKEVRA